MRLINKEDINIIDGYMVSDGQVIAVEPAIVKQAHHLETMVQKKLWLDKQPKACMGPDISEFKRLHNESIGKIETETPILDKKIEESMALIKELSEAQDVEDANKMIDQFKDLLAFAKAPYVIDNGCSCVEKFDTPVLGNPLEWTMEFLITWIATINEVDIDFVTNDGE